MGVQTGRQERISLKRGHRDVRAWVVCFQVCAAQIAWSALCSSGGGTARGWTSSQV